MNAEQQDLFEDAESLQNVLVARATGEAASEDDYRRLRAVFAHIAELEPLVPRFVRTCRTLGQFWGFIKYEAATYAERRQIIWDAFQPLLDHLEGKVGHPADEIVAVTLDVLDADHVRKRSNVATLTRRAP